MTPSPKTIQIFLPSGEPQEIRIAEITTRIVRVIEVPRVLLEKFLVMPEAEQVGVYFLVGEDESTAAAKLYIGQSGAVGKRLGEHNQKKDFWNKAVILVSLTNSLTQTHASFLEWYCIKQSSQAGRFQLENGNGGSKPHTPAPLEADCMEVFETGRVLLATLGYPVFEAVAKNPAALGAPEMFYCKRSGCDAVGEYTPEGFVVLQGSTGRMQVSPGFLNHHFNKKRTDLMAQGKLAIEGNGLVFKEDILFSSPSGASAVICGNASNGWVDWKSKDGVTLHDLKRAPTAK